MKQEQDNYCATLKTLHTTLFTQLIYFSYCI